MKFVFETGKEVICNDEAIAKLLRQDKRYKEVTTEEVEKKAKKNTKKTTDEVTTEEVENTETVEEKGETDAEIQE